MKADDVMMEWYKVSMFPAWVVEDHPIKVVRLIGLLFGFPWFLLFLPFTFLLFVFVALPMMIWEDI